MGGRYETCHKPSETKAVHRKISVRYIAGGDVLQEAQLHFFEKNEPVLKAGFSLEYYYLFVEGKVRVSYLLENGRAVLLKFYKEFQSLGDVELLDNHPIRCNIDTVTDSYFIGIPVEFLRKHHLGNPMFLRHLVRCLSEKFYAVCNNSSYNLTYPLTHRLASYLVEHITGEPLIRLHSSYAEIAQFLGSTYRQLRRTLKELEEQGIIACQGKQVKVLKAEALRGLSRNIYIHSIGY